MSKYFEEKWTENESTIYKNLWDVTNTVHREKLIALLAYIRK